MAAYIAHYLVMVGIYTILATSLNLLVGYSGIFSLAHAAIYGIGAYASALAALKLGLGFWGGLLVAAVVGALAAALVAIPSLRVAGDYYIVASFGLQMVILTVFINWTSFTNGHAGLRRHSAPERVRLCDRQPVQVRRALARSRRADLRDLPSAYRTPRSARSAGRARRRDRGASHRQERGAREDHHRHDLLRAGRPRRAASTRTTSPTSTRTSFTLDESIFITSLVILGGTERLAGSARGRLDPPRRARGAQVPRHPGHGGRADAPDPVRRAAHAVHVRAARRHPRPRTSRRAAQGERGAMTPILTVRERVQGASAASRR